MAGARKWSSTVTSTRVPDVLVAATAAGLRLQLSACSMSLSDSWDRNGALAERMMVLSVVLLTPREYPATFAYLQQ